MNPIIFGLLVAQIASATGTIAIQPQEPKIPAVIKSILGIVEYEREKTITEQIREAFPDAPIMVKVAQCESGLRQFNDKGEVIMGPTNDAGLFQIHLPSHASKLKELNLDVTKTEDNIKFARYLYDNWGLSHWKASRGCWNL